MIYLKKLALILTLMSALTIGAVGCGDDNDMDEAGEEVGETMEETGDEAEETTD